MPETFQDIQATTQTTANIIPLQTPPTAGRLGTTQVLTAATIATMSNISLLPPQSLTLQPSSAQHAPLPQIIQVLLLLHRHPR